MLWVTESVLEWIIYISQRPLSFLQFFTATINNGNRTERSPVRSIIIRVMKKKNRTTAQRESDLLIKSRITDWFCLHYSTGTHNTTMFIDGRVGQPSHRAVYLTYMQKCSNKQEHQSRTRNPHTPKKKSNLTRWRLIVGRHTFLTTANYKLKSHNSVCTNTLPRPLIRAGKIVIYDNTVQSRLNYIGHIRILGIGLELAWNWGLYGGSFQMQMTFISF